MSFVLLGILNSQAAGAAGATSYDLLETQVLSSTASSLTFTGLGSYTDYKHLQIRAVAQANTGGTNILNLNVNLNSDTGFNYTVHRLYGGSSSVQSASNTSRDSLIVWRACTRNADGYAPSVIDILDFSNTSKYTTIRGIAGGYASSEKTIALSSGVWMNTSALTSISFTNNGAVDFTAGSRFSLYGIKGA